MGTIKIDFVPYILDAYKNDDGSVVGGISSDYDILDMLLVSMEDLEVVLDKKKMMIYANIFMRV